MPADNFELGNYRQAKLTMEYGILGQFRIRNDNKYSFGRPGIAVQLSQKRLNQKGHQDRTSAANKFVLISAN